jgi:uncharacterized HAD superfamily protein
MNGCGEIERILVDVDGTLCRNLVRICEYVEQEYGVTTDPEDVDEWMYEFEEAGITVGEVAETLLRDHEEWYLKPLRPLAKARIGLEQLSAAGVEIVVLTHRLPSTHATTREWLDEHDLVYDEFVEDVPENKAAVPGDVLVDDFHGNIRDAVEAGMGGILFDQPYNSSLSSPRAAVAESWDDVVHLLLEDDSFPGACEQSSVRN